MSEQRDTRLVKLATLWQRKSAKTGKTYFSGFMGAVQLLMFRGEEITRDNGEVVQTWRLLCQERDPERRPQTRRDQPMRHARERVNAPERPGPDHRDFYDDTDLAVADLQGPDR